MTNTGQPSCPRSSRETGSMTRREKAVELKEFLDDRFGGVDCFLHYEKDYELLIAVVMSAQATDKSVNAVTPILFSKYDSLVSLAKADVEDVVSIIKPVGLANAKGKNIVKLAKILLEEYGGEIPKNREELMKLPGVGYKTSGVVLGELYDFPYLPVDTHVERVSKWLKLVNNDLKPEQIETRLEKLFEGYDLINTHKQLILLGREILTSRNPKWDELPFDWIRK